MEEDYKVKAKVFKAFCDPKRLEILELLKNGEQCACVLLEKLNFTQSGLSYHMKILTKSGVVVGRQFGKWTHYSISEQGINEAIVLLKSINTKDNLR